MLDPYDIILKVISSEKAAQLAERENKLIFEVRRTANKTLIKQFVEEMLEVKVVKVWTYITPKGRKRAIVKLAPTFKASDIASKLGIIT